MEDLEVVRVSERKVGVRSVADAGGRDGEDAEGAHDDDAARVAAAQDGEAGGRVEVVEQSPRARAASGMML